MKSSIREEIEQYFALHSGDGAYLIGALGKDYPAWVIKENGRYGVFVLYDGKDIYESFSGAIIQNRSLNIGESGQKKVLVLSSDNTALRNEFSLICEDFVVPGSAGERRSKLINHPLEWWEHWKSLLGDAEGNKMVFDIVGELWAVLKLYEIGEKPYWSAAKLNSHDIELTDESYEIKTTLKKEDAVIHVSSQFQFASDKPLYLVFTRLEESLTGKSIDDLLNEISSYESKYLQEYNQYLETKGYGIGNHYRKKKYVLLERRRYIVNDSFPRITDASFKNNEIPKGITHIEYTVNLDGLPHDNWK